MKHSSFDKIKAFVTLMRPETTPLAMVCVFVGGMVSESMYDPINLFLAVLVVFFATAGGMILNDYLDLEVDKVSHPNRSVPSGKITAREALYSATLFFLIALAISFVINILCFAIAIFSMFLLVLYEKFFKNQGIIGNMVVGFVSSISFVFGGAAVGQPQNSLIFSTIIFFIVTGREILMDVRDIEGDRLIRTTLPMQIGEKSATYVGCLLIAMTLFLTPLPFLWNILSIWYLLFIIPIDIIGIYAVFLSLRDIQSAGKTTDLVRIAAGLGLIGFIVGIVL